MPEPLEHKKTIDQWIKLADYRARSAKVLHESGQHLDAVFHYQQTIEYALKAYLYQLNKKLPARTHDLLDLVSQLPDPLSPKQQKIIDELHDVSVPLRYPDDIDEALASYTYDEVHRIGQETEEIVQWLKQKLKS